MAKLCVKMWVFLVIAVTGISLSTGARVSCKDGFIRWQKNCYKLIQDPAYTWPEAHIMCAIIGAQLTTIEAQAENNFLQQWAHKHGMKAPMWINLNDIANEGQWVSMKSGNYTAWCKGQPDTKDHTKHCAVMTNGTSTAAGCWANQACWDKAGIMCTTMISN